MNIKAGHSFDLAFFNFKKAFNKVSHAHIISSLANIGRGGNVLQWYRNFLSSRTQQVRVSNNYL